MAPQNGETMEMIVAKRRVPIILVFCKRRVENRRMKHQLLEHVFFKIATLTFLLFTAGCSSEKPSFTPPEMIIDRAQTSSLSSITSSSVRSSFSSSAAKSVLIRVPFSPQAPFAKWDALHEEACEEMSLLLVHHFLKGTSMTPSQAEEQLQALIAWETEHGFSYDVSVNELAEVAQHYFGHTTRVLENVTIESLKKEIALGHPIIVPMAGRLLKNPYFSGLGPEYHMIVLVGYDEKGFITNDPGTKRGESYWYSNEIILSALHDWTGVKDEIEQGAKRALIVE
jgi:uncharacterized protein YeaC (DUF1315 family)